MHGGSPNITSLLSLVVGVFVGVFAEPIRTYLFRPVLRASFDGNDEGYKAHTPLGSSEGYYVRAKVENLEPRLAKSCRAFLVNVEVKDDPRGEFKPTSPKYADSLPLKWSCQTPGDNETRPIDLPSGVSQFVDVVSMSKLATKYTIHTPFLPARYHQLFDGKPAVLRLTVLFTGDGVQPATVKIVFDWRGQWDWFDVAKG